MVLIEAAAAQSPVLQKVGSARPERTLDGNVTTPGMRRSLRTMISLSAGYWVQWSSGAAKQVSTFGHETEDS